MTYRYLAGFIDGEGCISIVRWNGVIRYTLYLNLSQKHRGVLDEIKSFLGFGSSVKKYKDCNWFQFQLVNRDAEKVLKKVLPYLVVKSLQARLALQFMKHKEDFRGRNLTEKELRWREMHRQLLKLYKGVDAKEVL